MECRSVYISPPIVFHGSRKVHSSELEIKFGKSPGAIKKLCGVVNRFEFGERENLVTCGVKVVRQLLDRDQIASESISGIIAAADATAPTFLPSWAVCVAEDLGLANISATTLQVGCNGSIQALELAYSQVRSNSIDGRDSAYVILVGDHTSIINDPLNWNTSIFFSDCVAALVVSSRPLAASAFTLNRVRTTILGGDGFDAINLPNPYYSGTAALTQRLIMAGSDVFRFAASVLDCVSTLLEEESFGPSDYLIPHQGNLRMLQKMIGRRGLRSEQVYTSGISTVGNTSVASVIFGFRDFVDSAQCSSFSRVLLLGFGAEKQIGVAELLRL